MPGPARAGAFLYAKDIEGVAAFYQSLLAMTRLHASSELIVLESSDMQLVVHAMPPEIAANVVIANPPEPRGHMPVKLFFTVKAIAEARAVAARHGGQVFPEQWNGPGFFVCNACDPEGNIFQVREAA